VLLNSLAGTQNFEVPKVNVRLSEVFESIERETNNLNILDWGISNTSLEEVFLHIVERVDKPYSSPRIPEQSPRNQDDSSSTNSNSKGKSKDKKRKSNKKIMQEEEEESESEKNQDEEDEDEEDIYNDPKDDEEDNQEKSEPKKQVISSVSTE